MTKMLNSLREETAELHRELEKENLANKIMDHSITLDEYRSLLFQNFIAYKSAENEISKFLPSKAEKTEKLKADLKGLGITDFNFDLDFSCENEAEAIGAAYVVEGSAMGGMLIGKEIKNCEALKELPEQQFFSGNRESMKGWNEFLKFLRTRDFTETEVQEAVNKGKDTFLLFGEAFKLEFSNSH